MRVQGRTWKLLPVLIGTLVLLSAIETNASAAPDRPRIEIRISPSKGHWVKSHSPHLRFRTPGLKAAAFTCQSDSGELAVCQSPFRAVNLRDGRHRFRVRAFSEAGELLAVGTRRFTVDTEPPHTRFQRSPKRRIETIGKRAKVTMRVRKGPRVRKLQCRVDRKAWHRCHRRITVWALPGSHRIRIRAVDKAGNRDRTPAVRRWKVSRWEPGIRAARRYAARRPGRASFAVDVGWRTQGLRINQRARTASTIKVLLMAAYLQRRGVRHRRLDSGERNLLGIMIRHSDNGAASTVRNIVGSRAVVRVARQGGMKRFRYSPVWGTCEVTARDFATFMRRLKDLIPERHRGFALHQLESITGSQRWGIGKVRPRGWKLYFKGGWGISDGHYGGVVDHQVAVLRRGKWKVGIAILTQGNSSVESGNDTLRGIARRLLRGLPR